MSKWSVKMSFEILILPFLILLNSLASNVDAYLAVVISETHIGIFTLLTFTIWWNPKQLKMS